MYETKNRMPMTNERKNGATKKVDFIVARYENEFKKMTKSQQEWVKNNLEVLFEWIGPDGYTISPAWVQVVYMREPTIILHWRCWADIAWTAGYRWRFEEIFEDRQRVGTKIHFWHKDTPDEKYEFYLYYKDYESKIRRWAQMDLEVMVCKTLIKNAISFFAPHIAAREPLALVATFDEYDINTETNHITQTTPTNFRNEVKQIMKERGLEPEAIRNLLVVNYNATKLDDLTEEQKKEFLQLLRQ